jgi:hypothetical protein
MPYKRTLPLLLALALLAPATPAQDDTSKPAAPDVARLRAHVTHLASEKLEGRRTGTPGAEAAALYVAEEFRRLGLAPGGTGSVNFRSRPITAGGSTAPYFQEFPYVAGVELGPANALALTFPAEEQGTETSTLRVGEDWMPLGFGSNGRVEAARVFFVGYGITAAEQNHDDYAVLKNTGGVALALPGTPDGNNPHGKFARAGEVRFKAAAARAAGAKALLIVAGEDDLRRDKLASFRYDNAGGEAGLPVAVVSRQAAGKILGLEDSTGLTRLEKLAAEAMTPAPSPSPGADSNIAGTVRLADVVRLPSTRVALSLTTDVVRKNAPAWNIVGVLEGSDPKLKSEVIVVGAHYDHLGRGGESSLAAREGEVHYGADDNASGTAGLLELARLFSRERARLRRTLVFIAFGGEEEGLIGSGFYARNPARPLEQTVAMLNMDMIGRLRGGALSVGGVGTAAELRAIVEGANRGSEVSPHPPAAAATAGRFTLRLSEDGYGPSDHSSFYARRVPVLFFFTGVHDDYHKPSDTAERVNYEGQALVVQFVRDIVERLQAGEKRPTYAVARSELGARSASFNVTLGTVPAYGESTDGLRLDAVREGSPAAAAGLRAGDRIVKLAGHEVRNIIDYTQALSGMKAGQEYDVEVVRDGQRLTLKVTPAARGSSR